MINKTGSLGIQFLVSMRDEVVRELQSLGAYQYYSAKSGSQYIKFEDPRIGSLRIGDHASKEKYRYKWNLLIGCKRRTAVVGHVERHYYPIEDVKDLCADIREARRVLLETRGEYDIARDPYALKRNRVRRFNR